MISRQFRVVAWATIACMAAPPANGADQPDGFDPTHRLSLIGVGTVARDAGPDRLPVGGLSGIDYDPRTKSWYVISDDKSEFGPARMWRARIDYDLGRPPAVKLVKDMPLRNESGRAFPPQGTGAEASDAESVRLTPRGNDLLWSSEGDARDGFGPAIRRMRVDGTLLGKIALPSGFAFDPQGRQGPRPNLSIEGLTFEQGGRSLWLSLEAPLFQDGDVARATTGALVRLTRIAFPSGRLLRQVAYPVEPIGPYPPGRLADNGVSEIMLLDHRHMLVIERSGVQQDDGQFRFRPRVYCAMLSGATDIAGLWSLKGARVRPVRKNLVIDFSLIAAPRIDNVEGVTLGPVLADGHPSLAFVTDNDFSDRRPTQVIAFEIKARPDRASIAAALCRD